MIRNKQKTKTTAKINYSSDRQTFPEKQKLKQNPSIDNTTQIKHKMTTPIRKPTLEKHNITNHKKNIKLQPEDGNQHQKNIILQTIRKT